MSKERDNTTAMSPKAIICGSNPVSQALGQICELLGLGLIKEANGKDSPDIIIIADSDEKLEGVRLSGKERLVYIESNNESTAKHNLYFLSEFLPTYRIPLERFSILELARILADIKVSIK